MKKDEKPVTIKDIARRLKLHHTTVSRALRGSLKISPETREVVLSLAEELGYHPNELAISFRTRKSKTIGVILPNVRDNFFSYVLSGIEDIAHKSGYYVMITQSEETFEREVLNIRALIVNHVCGALVCVSQMTRTGEHFNIFGKRKIPLAFFARVCDDIEASQIVVDNFGGAYSATEHLIKSGYQRIAHLAGPSYLLMSRKRLQGYRAALEKYQLYYDPELVIYCSLNMESGTKNFLKLWNRQKKPDAIFAVNDPVALGAFTEIKRKDLKIPADIALVGFGDTPYTTLIEPPLTTVRQSPYEMGKTAAEVLISQVKHPDDPLITRTKVIPTELIIRQST